MVIFYAKSEIMGKMNKKMRKLMENLRKVNQNHAWEGN